MSSVHNMLMQLQVYNTSGKYLIKIANSNQHREVFKIKKIEPRSHLDELPAFLLYFSQWQNGR